MHSKRLALYAVVALLSTSTVVFGAASKKTNASEEKLISSIVHGKHATTKKVLMQILNHALYMACEYSNASAAKLLLEHGADANAIDSMGNPVLGIAAEKNLTSTVELLLERGAQLEKQNKDGNTPLVHACLNGNGQNKAAIEKLLKAGANSKAKSGDNQTPLEIARDNNYSDIAALLEK